MDLSELSIKMERLTVLIQTIFENSPRFQTSELEALLGLAYDLAGPLSSELRGMAGKDFPDGG